MESLSIEQIIEYIKKGKIRWTNHLMIRLCQRDITQEDIEQAILNGEIIEEYKQDYPYPSCLILGKTNNNKIIHVVCGVGENELWIITSYYPNEDEWQDNLKTRKENK